MFIGYIFLAIRIVLLGIERILLKIIGSKGEKDQSIAVTTLFFGFGALFLFPLYFLDIEISIIPLIFSFISSLIYSIGFVLYSSSLRREDVSLVTPLYNFNLIFLFIFSAIFLEEKVTLLKITGILLIFLGISYLEEGSNFFDSFKLVISNFACQLMIISSLLIAVGRIIDGSLIKTVTPLTYSFYIYFFITIDLIIVLLVRKELLGLREVFNSSKKVSIASGFVNGFSYLALLSAMTYLEVSIVEPVSALNIFFAVILAYWIFNEDIKKRWFAVFLTVVGAILLLLAPIS